MIAGGEDRVDAHGGVEILLRTPEISEVVLGYAPEEIVLVVRGVEAGEDVEVLYCLRELAFGERDTTPVHEAVPVILGKSRKRRSPEKKGRSHEQCQIKCLYRFAHRKKITTFGGILYKSSLVPE